jgi:predicted TPR repeat methyltransferase
MCREPEMRAGECLFFALADGEDAPALPPGLRSERLLDRFHVVQEKQVPLREALLSGFFDAIAGQYRDLIDPRRNLENIQYLVDWLVGDLQAGEGTLIDLGCGTGVSREIVERTGRSVIA